MADVLPLGPFNLYYARWTYPTFLAIAPHGIASALPKAQETGMMAHAITLNVHLCDSRHMNVTMNRIFCMMTVNEMGVVENR